MARIVVVAGLGQSAHGPDQCVRDYAQTIRTAVRAVGGTVPAAEQISCVTYSDLFETMRPPDDVPLATEMSRVDNEIADSWVRAAVRLEPEAADVPATHQPELPVGWPAGAEILGRTKFFGHCGAWKAAAEVMHVRRYLTEPELREAVRERVAKVIGLDTRVVVGHGLGAVAAYETLCGDGSGSAVRLVTVGSPLGATGTVFERLEPSPVHGQARWPVPVRHWYDVASPNDLFAYGHPLPPRFGPGVQESFVDVPSSAHDARPYLASRDVARAIAAALKN